MLQIGNVLQSLGYFLPYTYISTYAVQQLRVSTTAATTLLVLINVTSIPGGIVIGGLGDYFHITTTVLISTIGSALAVFLFWGFSSQTALLAVFCITYGFFAGGFSSTWSGILQELKSQSPTLDTGFIFGLLAGGRGIGNVISGPLSVALVTDDEWTKDGRSWGYNGRFGGIILFTGATAVLGGWGAMGRVKGLCSSRLT
jgi:predicted MFS family arabinose efflux permease